MPSVYEPLQSALTGFVTTKAGPERGDPRSRPVVFVAGGGGVTRAGALRGSFGSGRDPINGPPSDSGVQRFERAWVGRAATRPPWSGGVARYLEPDGDRAGGLRLVPSRVPCEHRDADLGLAALQRLRQLGEDLLRQLDLDLRLDAASGLGLHLTKRDRLAGGADLGDHRQRAVLIALGGQRQQLDLERLLDLPGAQRELRGALVRRGGLRPARVRVRRCALRARGGAAPGAGASA